eukprot:1243073-Amphidinium_carterae.1
MPKTIRDAPTPPNSALGTFCLAGCRTTQTSLGPYRAQPLTCGLWRPAQRVRGLFHHTFAMPRLWHQVCGFSTVS